MRISDIILIEDEIDDMLEDEAVNRGDAKLLTTLEFLRSRAHDTHIQPKIRVDSLINLIHTAGEQQFNLDRLLAAYKTNTAVKNLIKDIKDDESGVKYVYLTPFVDDDVAADPDMSSNAPKTAPEKTVDAMAKSALAKRS